MKFLIVAAIVLFVIYIVIRRKLFSTPEEKEIEEVFKDAESWCKLGVNRMDPRDGEAKSLKRDLHYIRRRKVSKPGQQVGIDPERLKNYAEFWRRLKKRALS
ncbi:MAG: hypothetical protein WCX27_02995 [Candidatus Paceibacterota bacterium]|jgi:hypothetical protein